MEQAEGSENEFPGLYGEGSSKGKKAADDSEFSEGDENKVKILGRKKDKKEKNKYATLAGDSSPEEEDTKSPSKSTKKMKAAFKFPSKSKEKREKSRDKEKIDTNKEPIVPEVKEKKKEKDKKEKDKEKKVKDKDKKEKKVKQGSVSDELLELGDVQPVFGVSLGLSVERSRCHDDVNLPLVVRDCIDYLQEFGVKTENIYKVEPVKSRLQQLKKLYNNRESKGMSDLDVATACNLLKLFLKELPEPLLTTDLITRFEEISAISDVQQQEKELKSLVDQLPSCNRTLLKWVSLHLDRVTEGEKIHKMNAQSLAMLLSPTLQMSHRLFGTILCHCRSLFPNATLHRYEPPMTATSPNLPETAEDIAKELRKQESLLTQIHSEMNAGFVNKKREEKLWEVQRIITALKRKLRSFEKRSDPSQRSTEDMIDGNSGDVMSDISKIRSSDDESTKTQTESETKLSSQQPSPEHPVPAPNNLTRVFINDQGLLSLPENHPDYLALLQLQLENFELTQWQTQLTNRINQERSELFHLKKQLHNQMQNQTENIASPFNDNEAPSDQDESEMNELLMQNTMLQQTYSMLKEKLSEEYEELLQLQVNVGLIKYR